MNHGDTLGGEAPCFLSLLDEDGRVTGAVSALDSVSVTSRVRVKRVYEPADPDDGYRMLVDRIWPRGLSKEAARLDEWLRDIAPSHDLRRWFGHDPARWTEFVRRYRGELRGDDQRARIADIVSRARQGRITLLFAAHDTEHNNAIVLRDLVVSALETAR